MQNWLNSWNGIASEIMEQPASRPAPGLRPEDVSATTAKLRERAEEEYQLKRQAVDYGLPADEAASHREAMEFLNRVASEMIFFEKNKHGRPRQIDLHGLRVDEAKSRVDAIIILEDLSPNPVPFRFIVGKGRHNGDGRPRLRPALLEYIEAMPDYLVQVDPYNEGVIMVTNRETLRDP
ncbi:hypothetical protein C8R44DRAFT_757377 [Mycena epipterygia]|nr:hypothetical protein C8R44DRAFT_757377 [Mycena epipterygia]